MFKQKLKDHKIIAQNTAYLSIIELVRLAMPFVALPYIIKTVGAKNYGTIIFSQTIIFYFSMFINWGLDISAVKNVSVCRDNKIQLNLIVSNVLSIKFLLFCFSLILLFLGIIFVPYLRSNFVLYIFAFSTCLSEVLFPSWFYQGIEKMKYLTLIRLSSVLFYTSSIFIFIKSSSDYQYIPLLQSIGNILAGFISFYCLLKVEKISLLYPSIEVMKKYFIESIPFFVSRMSAVVNNSLARLVSGVFFSMDLVAAFDLAQKIVSASVIPIQMLNQAVYPHIAKTQNRIFANKFFYINVTISFFIACIVLMLAPIAVHFFSGDLLPDSIPLTRILCLWLFCNGITTYIGSPVLVSFGYPKPFNRSVILSTFSLFIFYLILYLFDQFSIYNLALSLFFSEFVILVYRIYYCYHYKIFRFNGKLVFNLKSYS